MHPAGSRSTARLLASLVAVAVVACTPLVLMWVGRQRFGGASPWSGVEPPWRWDATTIRDALTDRLTESVIVDVIIRVALAASWVAVAVILATIVAETIHMARHGGMALPSVRGLGWSQRFARAVAAGLIVVLPATHAPRAEVHAVPVRATFERSAAVVAAPALGPLAVPERRSPSAAAAAASYTVQAGDSVYQIAQRLTGGDRHRTVTVAEQILDLNVGTMMNDGQRFTNAAYIEPGWVLVLPAGLTPRACRHAGRAPNQPRCTSWSPARRCGRSPAKNWARRRGGPRSGSDNRGETMADGRVFDDPDLIMPGWVLDVPNAAGPLAVPQLDARPVAAPAVVVAPPPTPAASPSTTTTAPIVALPTCRAIHPAIRVRGVAVSTCAGPIDVCSRPKARPARRPSSTWVMSRP